MSYDPLFDVARKVMDESQGQGAYARLNQNNPGVPVELREELKRELAEQQRGQA